MKLHKESKGTLVVATLAILILGIPAAYFMGAYSVIVIVPLLILYGLVFWFFRVPNRTILEHTSAVIAPVDGKVVMIKEVEENEFLKEKCLQISIFMSPLNVHICRYPVTGKVIYKKYHPGKYLVAWHPKSSTENERWSVAVKNSYGTILYKQIAGALAKRICNYTTVGQQVKQTEEYGFIKFGSRVDILLPVGTKVNVQLNEVVKGGVTVLATW
jgi:phosphatidylserine decarboxylase